MQCRRPGFDPYIGKIPWRMEWQATSVFFPRDSHGQRRLMGYSLWDLKESHYRVTNTFTFTQTTKKFGKCLQEVFSLVFEFSISLPPNPFIRTFSKYQKSMEAVTLSFRSFYPSSPASSYVASEHSKPRGENWLCVLNPSSFQSVISALYNH